MRIIGLFITLILSGTMQSVSAQGVRASLPDTISLSDREIYNVFKSSNDTLGFRRLTDNTSLSEYKGKDNRDVIRAMRRIKEAMNDGIIFDEIAGKRIASLRNLTYANNPGEHHILCSPKYALVNNGVILIGEKDVWAPWNDVVTSWISLDCYFIGFDKKVSYIKTVRYEAKPSALENVIFLRDSLHYEYADSLPADKVIERIPPEFTGGTDELARFIISNARYPDIAVERGIQGDVAVSFLVNPDKTITDIRVTRSVDVSLDRESGRVVKLMNGLWEAGMADGVAVPVQVKLAIRFSLVY